MATPPILLTRPRPAAERFAAALGLPCLIAPLMAVRHLPLPGGVRAAVLTSRNAVAAWVAGGGARGLPAWCVGPGTAADARAAGFAVRGMAPTAKALVPTVPGDAPPLTHLRGAVIRCDLAGALRARGLRASDAVVYAADPLPLSPEAADLARAGPVVAPVFSPRAARRLAAAWPADALDHLRPIALSEAVAAALPVPAACTAQTPDEAGMLRAVRTAIAC